MEQREGVLHGGRQSESESRVEFGSKENELSVTLACFDAIEALKTQVEGGTGRLGMLFDELDEGRRNLISKHLGKAMLEELQRSLGFSEESVCESLTNWV